MFDYASYVMCTPYVRINFYLWHMLQRLTITKKVIVVWPFKFMVLHFKKTVNNMFFTLTTRKGAVQHSWSIGNLGVRSVKRKRSKFNFISLLRLVVSFVKVKRVCIHQLRFPLNYYKRNRRVLKRFLKKRHLRYIVLINKKPHNGLRGKKLKRR